MPACWNCGRDLATVFKFCNKCGKAVPHDQEQTRRLIDALDFLLGEVAGWSWLDKARKQEIEALYLARRARLAGAAGDQPAVAKPEAVPGDQPAVGAPGVEPGPATEAGAAAAVDDFGAVVNGTPHINQNNRLIPDGLTEKNGQSVYAAQGVGQPGMSPIAAVAGFMEERNIRWFHTVGGLLLLAGCIGFLRSQWSAVGRYVIMLVMLFAPIGSFAGAYALRRSLPISSRLLSILGGLLLPAGLLGLRQFGLVPESAGATWNAFSFGLSAAVLLGLTALLTEPACLYLSAISLALSAVSLQPLVGHFPLSGAIMLAGAVMLVALERFGMLAELRLDLVRSAHLLAGLALIATLPNYNAGGSEQQAMVVFFIGAAFFAMAGRMLEQPNALYAAAIVGTLGFAAEISYWHLPWIDLGFFWLLLGAFFQSLAWGRDANDPLATAALRLGFGAAGIALVLLCGNDIARGLDRGFEQWPPAQAMGSLVLAVLASIYYAVSARLFRRPAFIHATAAAAAYAWLLLAVVARCGYAVYPPFLAVFPLLALGLALLLRGRLDRTWLEPIVRVAVGVTFIPAALCLLSLTAPTVATCPLSWQSGTLALLAAFYVLLTRWTGDPTPLPAACLYVVTAWSRGVQAVHGSFAWGLYFMPLVALLCVLALLVDRLAGRRWAHAIAVTALVVLTGVLFTQPVAWSFGAPHLNAWILLATTLIAGLSATPFKDWWSGQRLGLALATVACLALPAAALQTAYALSWPLATLQAGLYTLAIAYLMVARPLRGNADWSDALRAAGLTTSAVLWIFYLPSEAWQKPLAGVLPGAIWLATALLEKNRGIGAGSVLLLVLAGAACEGFDIEHGEALLRAERITLAAAFTFGYAALARRFDGFLAVSWVISALGWMDGMLLVHANESNVWQWLGWWPFQVLWAVPMLWNARSTLRTMNQVTMGGLLLVCLFARPPQAFFCTALAYSIAIGWWAGRQGRQTEASGALVLATAGWIHLAVRLELSSAVFALVSGLVAVAAAAAASMLRPLTGNWRMAFLKPLVTLAFGLALVAWISALQSSYGAPRWQLAVLGSVLAAATLAMLVPDVGVLGWHGAYAMLHVQLLMLLPLDRPLEWVTLPLAAWLLLWSTLSQGEKQARFEVAAAAAALLPSIAASLVSVFGVHAVSAGVAGLTLLLFGASRQRLLLQTAGTSGILLEALVQMHRALVSQPWQVYATVAGILLIALGLLFERRRQQIVAFGARLMGQVV